LCVFFLEGHEESCVPSIITTATVVNFPLLQPMQQDNQEVAAMGKLAKGWHLLGLPTFL